MTIQEEEEDPRNMNIPKIEGHHEVEIPQVENQDISVPLQMKKVSISIKEELKFAKIGDYWDNAILQKVAELLHEYQDLFPTKFLDLKGIVADLRVMNITFRLGVKPIK